MICTIAFSLQGQKSVDWKPAQKGLVQYQAKPKDMLIYFYTDWCGWCRRMENESFSNKAVVDYMNRSFLCIKFNAESMDTLVFGKHQYVNRNTSKKGAHDWVIYLLQGKVGYPAIVFINERAEVVTAVWGFRAPKELEALLHFIKEKHYIDQPNFDEYLKTFKSSDYE